MSRRVIGDDLRLRGVQNLNVVERRRERRRRVTDKLGDSLGVDEPGAVIGAFGPGDQPFFVANQENGARSRQRLVTSLGIQLLITPDRHDM